MELTDKYISEKDNALKPDLTKTAITNDAFAICEFINHLIKQIEKTRVRG